MTPFFIAWIPRIRAASFVLVGAAASAACGTPPPTAMDVSRLDASDAIAVDVVVPSDVVADADLGPVSVRMDLSLEGGFYVAPFPGEHRRREDGSVDVSRFPNPRRNDYAASLIALAGQRDGFGLTSAVYFQLTGSPNVSRLPSVAESVTSSARVFLVAAQSMPGEPQPARVPVEVTFQSNGGPFGAPNMLVVRPVQGFVLRPSTLYAAVVLREVRDTMDRPLEAAPALRALVEGQRVDALSSGAQDSYRRALDSLRTQGVALSDIAGLTVFRTGDPTADFQRFRTHAIAQPPIAPIERFRRTELFDTFCVYESVVEMPVYQRGEPPYTSSGGEWTTDMRGTPMVQRRERARLVLTVPRATMPSGGYPIVVFSRTGGGGDRPLVERGVRGSNGGPPLAPGTGPALEFARAGWAGISPDGPHGGLRNVTRTDEQLLVFNFGNLGAMRDNVRQSALELVLVAHALPSIRVDASDCPGATAEARFDTSSLAIMGHSMGASIAPLAVAFEPRFRAMLLSGAGASWTENVVHKLRPLAVRPLAEALVGYTGTGRMLRGDDPILNILQWAGETSDAQVFNRYVIDEPPEGRARHVLMMQGIVDHYIMPPIANAGSLSLGLDLGGQPLDATTMELARFTPIASLLGFAGRSAMALPARGNRASQGAMVTAILTQTREDGVEDGHEVVFQTEAPRRQYRCFLESLARGVPRVPAQGALGGACE